MARAEIKMDEAQELRRALVEQMKRNQSITQPNVAAAMQNVPRHLFLPDVPLAEAYADRAIPTKFQNGVPISSCSQPAIVAIMLEQLNLRAGERVLEIGAGTGYNAALMSQLVDSTGHITTIDIDDDIAARARENLQRAGVTNVEVIQADGGFGYAPNAPYDAIVATVGIWDISPHWFEQLRERARFVAPLWLNSLQLSIAFEKKDGALVSASIRPCGFMRLRGEFAGPELYHDLDGLTVGVEDPARINADALRALLTGPAREESSRHLAKDSLRGVAGYLALRGEPFVSLFTEESEKFGFQYGFGLFTGSSLTIFSLQADNCIELEHPIRVYGDDSSWLRLNRLVREWEQRGRPTLERARISAAPLGTLPERPYEFVIRKHSMEYRVNF